MSRKRIIGNGKNNALNGSATGDDIYGLGGNDTLNGGDGHDRLYGGIGNDVLNGGRQDDQLYGEAGNDRLNGGEGEDSLYGGAGRDTITGGAGHDLLSGGLDRDSFVFDFATNVGTDTIRGFEAKVDTIDFTNVRAQNINLIEATQKIEFVEGSLQPVVTLAFKQGFVTQTEIKLEGFNLGYDGTVPIFYLSPGMPVTDREIWAAVNSALSFGKTTTNFDV
jgi:hypothetical protein